ncbi:unnamed protein product [Soboliphyme baturini]|uniref:Uncharacterized protein n=1 Tax=Soboliphyme baturini TaxID=241478 RepID=A0A183J478_9BILA|nr:unnamed protein product [Soboliphyme baturini]
MIKESGLSRDGLDAVSQLFFLSSFLLFDRPPRLRLPYVVFAIRAAGRSVGRSVSGLHPLLPPELTDLLTARQWRSHADPDFTAPLASFLPLVNFHLLSKLSSGFSALNLGQQGVLECAFYTGRFNKARVTCAHLGKMHRDRG